MPVSLSIRQDGHHFFFEDFSGVYCRLLAKTAIIPTVEMLPNQHEHADDRTRFADGLRAFRVDAECDKYDADHQSDGP